MVEAWSVDAARGRMMPMGTIDITVELPPPNAPLSTIDANSFALAATLVAYGIVASVFALIGWLMWLVVHHRRRSRSNSLRGLR